MLLANLRRARVKGLPDCRNTSDSEVQSENSRFEAFESFRNFRKLEVRCPFRVVERLHSSKRSVWSFTVIEDCDHWFEIRTRVSRDPRSMPVDWSQKLNEIRLTISWNSISLMNRFGSTDWSSSFVVRRFIGSPCHSGHTIAGRRGTAETKLKTSASNWVEINSRSFFDRFFVFKGNN